MNQLSTIATFYKEGGIYMHAVLVIAVVIIAIVMERAIVIGRASAVNSRKLTDDLMRAVGRGDWAGAHNISRQSSAPVAKVAQAMLESGVADETALQIAAEDAATLTLPDLSKRLPYLSVFANSATLIGLLGTISGLITAISGVGVADAAQRSAYLAAGISEALHTTAFGLIVAIPTLMLQGWLSGRVEGVAQDVDQLGIRLSKAMAQAATRAHAQPPAPVVLPRPSAVAIPLARPATGTLGVGR
jgi:biopolymer transport protein ExbB